MAEESMKISTFKAEFDGGTRPNRFMVNIDGVETILVKAASIPAETIGILQIPFRGRVAKLPGDRAYAEWTFTVLDDVKHNIRDVLVKWHRKFNQHESNIPDNPDILGGSDEDNYKTITVKQLNMTGDPHTCVNMEVCWPVEVGAIDLSYDTADQATEFSCTLAYDYLSAC